MNQDNQPHNDKLKTNPEKGNQITTCEQEPIIWIPILENELPHGITNQDVLKVFDYQITNQGLSNDVTVIEESFIQETSTGTTSAQTEYVIDKHKYSKEAIKPYFLDYLDLEEKSKESKELEEDIESAFGSPKDLDYSYTNSSVSKVDAQIQVTPRPSAESDIEEYLKGLAEQVRINAAKLVGGPAVIDPILKSAVIDPVLPKTSVQPVLQKPFVEPMSQKTPVEPVSQKTVVQPVSHHTFVNPILQEDRIELKTLDNTAPKADPLASVHSKLSDTAEAEKIKEIIFCNSVSENSENISQEPVNQIYNKEDPTPAGMSFPPKECSSKCCQNCKRDKQCNNYEKEEVCVICKKGDIKFRLQCKKSPENYGTSNETSYKCEIVPQKGVCIDKKFLESKAIKCNIITPSSDFLPQIVLTGPPPPPNVKPKTFDCSHEAENELDEDNCINTEDNDPAPKKENLKPKEEQKTPKDSKDDTSKKKENNKSGSKSPPTEPPPSVKLSVPAPPEPCPLDKLPEPAAPELTTIKLLIPEPLDNVCLDDLPIPPNESLPPPQPVNVTKPVIPEPPPVKGSPSKLEPLSSKTQLPQSKKLDKPINVSASAATAPPPRSSTCASCPSCSDSITEPSIRLIIPTPDTCKPETGTKDKENEENVGIKTLDKCSHEKIIFACRSKSKSNVRDDCDDDDDFTSCGSGCKKGKQISQSYIAALAAAHSKTIATIKVAAEDLINNVSCAFNNKSKDCDDPCTMRNMRRSAEKVFCTLEKAAKDAEIDKKAEQIYATGCETIKKVGQSTRQVIKDAKNKTKEALGYDLAKEAELEERECEARRRKLQPCVPKPKKTSYNNDDNDTEIEEIVRQSVEKFYETVCKSTQEAKNAMADLTNQSMKMLGLEIEQPGDPDKNEDPIEKLQRSAGQLIHDIREKSIEIREMTEEERLQVMRDSAESVISKVYETTEKIVESTQDARNTVADYANKGMKMLESTKVNEPETEDTIDRVRRSAEQFVYEINEKGKELTGDEKIKAIRTSATNLMNKVAECTSEACSGLVQKSKKLFSLTEDDELKRKKENIKSMLSGFKIFQKSPEADSESSTYSSIRSSLEALGRYEVPDESSPYDNPTPPSEVSMVHSSSTRPGMFASLKDKFFSMFYVNRVTNSEIFDSDESTSTEEGLSSKDQEEDDDRNDNEEHDEGWFMQMH